MDGKVRLDVRVEGIVQGVGFRPFVHALATRLGLTGRVGNDVDGVFVEVEGGVAVVDEFVVALRRDAPPLAVIERISVTGSEPVGTAGFAIAASEQGGVRHTLISADSATCVQCLRELADPADRRYRYPFVNCTNCGPRFSIIKDVPYDRPYTTMAPFAMCGPCATEYHDPVDRRFHAQPTCCPDCGPRLRLTDPAGTELPGDPITATAALLDEGKILAVKGLGGYHLAVRADHEAAAQALRDRKHREDKPFAVMVADLDAAVRLCTVDEAAAASLTGRRRPIVLMARKANTVAAAVAPGNRSLGLMLPYTPLHHLLLAAVAGPLVLTSGNVSDEPIAYRDADAYARLAGIADAFLSHDRAIHLRTDDSVVRSWRGQESVLRRSRGYVPEPMTLPAKSSRHLLGCGAELKNTFCVAKDGHAFVSHHIGDLENFETLRSFTEGIDHFGRLFEIEPTLVAHDLHPEYLSTKYAHDLADVELLGVQHHHAHIASCLADNGELGPVLGVAFDGTGYGTDGTIWGGEFLLADLTRFQRLGHLAQVRMPGGTQAIRQPWRMAASYLDDTPDLDIVERNRTWADVVALGRSGLNSPLTSSAGRLFDAVAALLGVRDEITYEGQAAVELEQLADPGERGSYPMPDLDGRPLVHAVVDDLGHGTPKPVVAARFHNAVADAIAGACTRFADTTGVTTVALSGGVFQNLLLLDRAVDRLSRQGLRVLTHRRVPTNDGGISFGQVAIAAATSA